MMKMTIDCVVYYHLGFLLTIVLFCGSTNVFDFALLPRKHCNLASIAVTFNVSIPEISVRVALTTAAVAGDEVASPFFFFNTTTCATILLEITPILRAANAS